MHKESWVVRAGCWLTRRRSVLFAPFFTVVLLTARLAPSSWIEWIQDLSGLLCVFFGTWLRLLSASYHESSHEDHPITAGPYAWIRHPLYLANFLLGLGIVLMAGWRPMWGVYLLIFIPLHWLIIRSEEVHLSGMYGKKYTQYLRSVPAVIPWRRYRGSPYGLRNDYKMKKGREWLKVAGYGIGAAGILLFKAVRSHLQIPAGLCAEARGGASSSAGLAAFPVPSWILAVVIIVSVTLRPQTRSSLLRTFQTALVILCAILIALRVPGAIPKPTTGGIP